MSCGWSKARHNATKHSRNLVFSPWNLCWNSPRRIVCCAEVKSRLTGFRNKDGDRCGSSAVNPRAFCTAYRNYVGIQRLSWLGNVSELLLLYLNKVSLRSVHRCEETVRLFLAWILMGLHTKLSRIQPVDWLDCHVTSSWLSLGLL